MLAKTGIEKNLNGFGLVSPLGGTTAKVCIATEEISMFSSLGSSSTQGQGPSANGNDWIQFKDRSPSPQK